MNDESKRPLHPLVAIGFAAFAAGALAWLWFGEWRWAVTGLVAMMVLVIAGAALDGREAAKPAARRDSIGEPREKL